MEIALSADNQLSKTIKNRRQWLQSLKRKDLDTEYDTSISIAEITAELDQQQREVILSVERAIRLIAPAGSGKTQTIVHRVAHRMRQGIQPERILVLTFDNSAVTALEEKFALLTKRTMMDFGRVSVMTLNAFGYRLLKKYVPQEYKRLISDSLFAKLCRQSRDETLEIDPKASSVFLDEDDLADSFAKSRIQDALKLPSQAFRDIFSYLKNAFIDPRRVDREVFFEIMRSRYTEIEDPKFESEIYDNLINIYVSLERAMRNAKVMDFDDQKLRSCVALRDDATLRRTIQRGYTDIIVDEFQDINLLDLEFIRLVSEGSNLMVTGDDDQAIYGFRGCSSEFIVNLDTYLEMPIATYTLQNNYRCPPNVMRHADMLIRYNKNRVPKEPVAKRISPADISVRPTSSTGIEAKYVLARLKDLRVSSLSLSYKDFAVLYRLNAQSLPLQVEFVLNDIPYYVRNEDNIATNESLERLIAILRLKLALDNGQQPAAPDVVLALRAYFKSASYSEPRRKLDALFREKGNFWNTIRSRTFYEILPNALTSNLDEAIVSIAQAKTLPSTIAIIAANFKQIHGMAESLEEALHKQKPLAELSEVVANLDYGIEKFVCNMGDALEKAKEYKTGNDYDNGVKLLTYFKSKGLQWHTVVLLSCNEGIMPRRGEDLESERRLFYVGMTRASANLVISYVDNLCEASIQPSRFLHESGFALPKS